MRKLIAAILRATETDRAFPLQTAIRVAKDDLSTTERLAGVEALVEGEKFLNEAERIIQATGRTVTTEYSPRLRNAFLGRLRDIDVLQF